MSYRIKSVSELTGINAATLRAWERRYRLVTPGRTRGGYRVYSDADVSLVARVKALVDRGLKVGEAVEIVRRGESGPSLHEAAESPEHVCRGMMDALLALDREGAERLWERVAPLPPGQVVEELFVPLLHEVGLRWEREEATVAQEHFASAFVREKLSGMLGFLSAAPVDGPEAVCAGAPGELHELGLMAVAVHLAARGWRVTYLGADLPLEDLSRTLRARSPALLCTSVVQRVTPAECRETVRRLREAAPDGTYVLLGGGGIPGSHLGSPGGGVSLVRSVGEAAPLLGASRT